MKVCTLVRPGLPEDATVRIIDSGRLDFSGASPVATRSDLSALELALTWREREEVYTVVSCAIGDETIDDLLHLALSMGADEVVRVSAPCSYGNPELTAAAFARVVQDSGAQVVLCGHECDFDSTGMLAYSIAARLQWPVVTGIVEVEHRPGELRVLRRLEQGALETVAVRLPAVVAVCESVAAARYVGRAALARARRQPVPVWTMAASEAAGGIRGVESMGMTYARPLPADIDAPDEGLPALERLEHVISAGVGAREGRLLEGEPEEISARLVGVIGEWLGW
jgi:electron transfer flavoprotein beta subunit